MATAGRILAAGLVAAIVGVIVAPQALAVVVWLSASWLPDWAARPLAHGAYELGLWGSGLATFLVAQRFGWLSGRRAAVLVSLGPALCETALPLAFGLLAPGIASWTGFVMRLLVGAPILFAAVRLARGPTSK